MKIKVCLFIILALLAILLLFAGCINKTEILPIEGIYRVAGTDKTLELKNDGSYLLKDGPSGRGGSYQVKGNKVIFEFAGIEAERSGKLKDGIIILDGYEYEKQP